MSGARISIFGACRLHPRVAASLPHFCATLSRHLSQPMQPVMHPSYEELFDAFVAGKIDLGWLPPLVLARALTAGGTLLAIPERAGALTYRAAILVHAPSKLHVLSDLRGLRAAWVDRSSASGYLFPRMELMRHGFDTERPFSSEMFHGATVRAAAAVASGAADFCACFVTDGAAKDPKRAMEDLKRALGPLADRLRPLHIGKPIPPDGLVAPAHLLPKERDQLSRTLLSLHETDDGTQALQGLLQATRLYAPVESTFAQLA